MLYQMGPAGAAGTGLTGIIADRIGRDKSEDDRAVVELNLDRFSNPVLLGHASHSTVMPALDADAGQVSLQRHIGEMLNMYSNINSRIAASWAGDLEGSRHLVRLVAPIPMFEFPLAVPIREIHEVTSFGATTRLGHDLLTRLDALPPAARQDELDRLAEVLRQAKAHRPQSRFISMKYAMAAAGLALAFSEHPFAGIVALLLPWSNVHQMAEPLVGRLRRPTSNARHTQIRRSRFWTAWTAWLRYTHRMRPSSPARASRFCRAGPSSVCGHCARCR